MIRMNPITLKSPVPVTALKSCACWIDAGRVGSCVSGGLAQREFLVSTAGSPVTTIRILKISVSSLKTKDKLPGFQTGEIIGRLAIEMTNTCDAVAEDTELCVMPYGEEIAGKDFITA
jgi:hypothetical protein